MSQDVARSAVRSIVVISDWIEGEGHEHGAWSGATERAHDEPCLRPWPAPPAGCGAPDVVGGYLERLPLAMIASGAFDQVEVWHRWRGEGAPPFRRESPWLARRAFRVDAPDAGTADLDMMAFVRRFGAPHLLLVLGLGVGAALLDLCRASVRIYNSIDAPALRVPAEVSACFDGVLTGAEWQSQAVRQLHPEMPTAIMPIGPEFAATDQFRPLGTPKEFDLIYVAAAQPYKRHDILFDALARCPRDVRALCVFGYGELADELRERAIREGLAVEFVGPPGVPFEEVNRLMNRACFGVVCGIDDGAPAILTEYMLAGLPVLANAELSCGRQFILPTTGRFASGGEFADAIMAMRRDWRGFSPRSEALARWTWPHTAARLGGFLENLLQVKQTRRSCDAT